MNDNKNHVPQGASCQPSCCAGAKQPDAPAADATDPLSYFDHMIDHCYDYAIEARRSGKHVVGILCEFTPRELILAAGGVPVCLCGGSADTIPAAEEILPANLCPLIKSTFGYHLQKSNPFLEMADLIVAETTCDGKKKMYEQMALSRPMHVLELPQKPGDPDAMEHWLAELYKLRTHLETLFDQQVTDARLRAAIELMNRERRLRRQLAALMQADNPPITGRQLLKLQSSIAAIPADLDQYEAILSKLKSGTGVPPVGSSPDRVREQAGQTHGQDAHATKTPVRVLLTGVPIVHGAHRVLDIIEDNGGLVVCMENCSGLKPIIEDIDASAADPMLALATKYFHLPCSVMTPNDRRLDLLRDLVRQYRPQCIIDLIWQACITYDVESHRVKQFAQKHDLPYLRICTDYSPSDSPRIAIRVEALYETVRARITR
jgi:benzoyl-CoA reductase/2-hydroxyglutaryl-CoA dehydratase subunit BcrC/BadD/HgdB